MRKAEEIICGRCPQKQHCDYIKIGRVSKCTYAGYFTEGYEQAIEDAIAYLKANAEKYIVDCTPTYPDAPQKLIIGGMLYKHLRQSLTDE